MHSSVVMVPSSYNVILGHRPLNSLRAITSTFHLKMKFPMPMGIGEACGEQKLAQECYT